jgi:hypothetical protein
VHRGGLASKPSAPVPVPLDGGNVDNPRARGSAATPASGSRFVGMRRRVVAAVRGETICDECGTAFDTERCPTCAQRRRHLAGLEMGVETEGSRPIWVTVERCDDDDGAGWWPTAVRPLDDGQGDDEPDGWPW